MKKLGFYAVIVTALVFTLWFCTKDGPKPDEAASPPLETVGSVTIESRSMGKKVRVENEEDIKSLSETLMTLTEENGMMVDLSKDFPEHMRDWTIEWLSPEGESQAVVEISRAGTVFREDQCFNFLGGDIFDMDSLRGLLLGLPEVREPEQLLDVDSIARANLYSPGGNAVVIRDEPLAELKDMLRAMSFYKSDENLLDVEGCGFSFGLFDMEDRSLGNISFRGNKTVYNRAVYGTDGDIDDEWISRMAETMPEASYGDIYPVVDFKYSEDLLDFTVHDEGSSEGALVRITDPELVGRFEGEIQEMEFKAFGPDPGEEPVYCISRWFADDYLSPAVWVIDEETIRYGGWLYKLMDGRKFDLELYAQITDPEGPYKNHPGVLYWKDGDPPMPRLTPRPSPTPDPELGPEPTPAIEIMDSPPQEKVFDLEGGYILMQSSDGNAVVIKDKELEGIARELKGLSFGLREQCTIDSYCMHAQKEDKERYHGNPLFTLTWYDKDGYKREEFTARGMAGWIDYNGWYYQAKEGGIDIENLKRLNEDMPGPKWYEWRPIERVQEDISKAKSLWITDEDNTWAAVVTDTELLGRISDNLKGKEFFAQKDEGETEGYAYGLDWYEGVLGPLGRSENLETLWVRDRYSIRGGYKLREGEIDMDLLDELSRPDGKYSAREGVKFVYIEDIVPEDNRT